MNKDLKSIEWKPLIIAIAIPLAVGGAAAMITRGGFDDYGALHRPAVCMGNIKMLTNTRPWCGRFCIS